ncbi:metallophosphoesterase [Candidatus Saccharibacteria bacterium]|nr:MAG: metallophosphoesterase [Candidatus Saccharibacteria bacterium]
MRTAMFAERMTWIRDNQVALNIKFMVQNGDLVDWDDETHTHYERADTGLAILDAVNFPYALCIGNHDTAAVQYGGGAAPGNVNTNLRNSSTFNSYFPVSRFPNIAGVFETGKVDNAYRTFQAAGLHWLVMNLEFCPRASVYTWANGVIQSHANHNVIILTHMYLEGNGAVSGSNAGYGDTSPQTLYNTIIKDNPNVKFTFSGHLPVWSNSISTSPTTGHKTYNLMDCWHDYSSNPTRVCTFDIPAGTVSTQIYDPKTNTWRSDTILNFTGISWVT